MVCAGSVIAPTARSSLRWASLSRRVRADGSETKSESSLSEQPRLGKLGMPILIGSECPDEKSFERTALFAPGFAPLVQHIAVSLRLTGGVSLEFPGAELPEKS